MKKIIISIFLFIYAQAANAGSCPLLLTEIENKLNEIEKLKDAGKKAHDDGDHAKSEKLFNKALSMLNN